MTCAQILILINTIASQQQNLETAIFISLISASKLYTIYELVNIYKNICYLFIYCKTTKMYDVTPLKCTLLYKVILLIQHSNIHQPYGVRMKFKSCPGTYSFLDRWTVLTNHRGLLPQLRTHFKSHLNYTPN